MNMNSLLWDSFGIREDVEEDASLGSLDADVDLAPNRGHGALEISLLRLSSLRNNDRGAPAAGGSHATFGESLQSFTSANTFSNSAVGGGLTRHVTVGNLTFVTDEEMATMGHGDDDVPERGASPASPPPSATLGTGAFSTVRLAWRKTPDTTHGRQESSTPLQRVQRKHGPDKGELVAVKVIQKSILKQMKTLEKGPDATLAVRTAFDGVEREIATMRRLRHPNLVRLLEAVDSVESDRLFMVLEYVSLGEILSHVEGTDRYERMRHRGRVRGLTADGHYDQQHAALYFVDVLHGLTYLHWHRICHRDLKPENILLCASGIAKIGDFGVAHTFEDEPLDQSYSVGDLLADCGDAAEHEGDEASNKCKGMLKKADGTWYFWSPEMCSHESEGFSGYSSDLWAAGICLYIFTTGLVPFFSLVPTDLFALIAEANVRYEGLGMSDALQDLLGKMLSKDPGTRPGVSECLTHDFCASARVERISTRSRPCNEPRIPVQHEVERAVSVTLPRNQDTLHDRGSSAPEAEATKDPNNFKFQRKSMKKIWRNLTTLRSSRNVKGEADAKRLE